MSVRQIVKQLAGKEDLLTGVGSEIQERNKKNIEITKLNATHLEGAIIVDTIKDLISLDLTKLNDGAKVFVLGFHQPNDDGGGLFYYDKSKPQIEHNGGTIIDPNHAFPDTWPNSSWFDGVNTDNGCFVRLLENDYITPEMFGANGDGITDDTLAIQNTINNHKNIQFYGKTYFVNTIYTNYDDSVINGNKCFIKLNNSSFIIKNNRVKVFDINFIGSTNDFALKIDSSRDTDLSGINFDNLTNCLLFLSSNLDDTTRNGSVRNININGAITGIKIGPDVHDLMFTDIFISGNGNTDSIGLLVDSSNSGGALYGGNKFNNITVLNFENGIKLYNTHEILVSNSIFDSCINSCIDIENSERILLTGIWASTSNLNGIALNNSQAQLTNSYTYNANTSLSTLNNSELMILNSEYDNYIVDNTSKLYGIEKVFEATITAGNTTCAANHNLNIIPDVISLTVVADGGTNTRFWVTDIDTTSFVINIGDTQNNDMTFKCYVKTIKY